MNATAASESIAMPEHASHQTVGLDDSLASILGDEIDGSNWPPKSIH